MAKVGRLVKELAVRELATALSERQDFFVTAVGNLQAVEADALRKRLQGAHSRLFMAKRTFSLRSLSELKLDSLQELLAGSVAFVLPGEEVAQVAKLIVEFAKAHGGKLIIRGGWVDGQRLDSKRVEELASLPPKPTLMAHVIGSLEAPITSLIFGIEGLLSELVWVLEAAAKKREAT